MENSKIKNNKAYKRRIPVLFMEKTYVTKEDLNEFMRKLEEIKSTIEVLQDKTMMEEIEESETLEKQGVATKNIL